MSTATPTLPPAGRGARAVADYVAAVRHELRDLPREVADDLVDGLDADLADAAAESATPLADRLGPPERYAAELRDAAGLAPRSPGPRGWGAPWQSPREAWADDLTRVRGDLARAVARLRSEPWWPEAAATAAALRPAWWVARAWVALVLLTWAIGGSGLSLDDVNLVHVLVLVALVAASARVGRSRWSRPWQRRSVLAGNVLAVLALPAVLGALAAPQVTYVEPSGVEQVPPATGLYLDGRPVSNLHPYDAQGQPLTGVQLLDDYGRPVQVAEENRLDWSDGTSRPFLPVVDVEGRMRWNAYPLVAAGAGARGAPPPPPPHHTPPPPRAGGGLRVDHTE